MAYLSVIYGVSLSYMRINTSDPRLGALTVLLGHGVPLSYMRFNTSDPRLGALTVLLGHGVPLSYMRLNTSDPSFVFMSEIKFDLTLKKSTFLFILNAFICNN